MTAVDNCHFISLPSFPDARGKLSFVETGNGNSSFKIMRMYFLYDVPYGASRAGHGHKELSQLFFAFSGSYDLHLDDGFSKKTVRVDRPDRPFFVCPRIWRVLDHFTSGAVCCVLADRLYDETDYLRSYDDFLSFVR